MKRLCIYLIYDKENIVDKYIGYILKELKNCVTYLIVVYNGKEIQYGKEHLEYADEIFFRENKGYDAGGYKDALCSYIGWNTVFKYDELILLNDSFFGPIYPIENIFNCIKNINVDFWGITRHPAGKQNGIDLKSHIQSYFICFRQNVIQSKEFFDFWNFMVYPETFQKAVDDFELKLNEVLEQAGFLGTTLMELCNFPVLVKENENPYLLYSLELIRDGKIPFFKRKSLDFRNQGYNNALSALKYVEKENRYMGECIKQHFRRKSKIEKGMLNYEELERFYHKYQKIYIYGAGCFGQNLSSYFEYKGWKYENFLVTKKETQESCLQFEQARISSEDGIIIALGTKTACMDIVNYIGNRCSKQQLFLPNYD